jgi:hypothetical protein
MKPSRHNDARGTTQWSMYRRTDVEALRLLVVGMQQPQRGGKRRSGDLEKAETGDD